jgi:hypothetical protein
MPPDDCLDARWVGCVGFVAVGSFLKVSIAGADIRDVLYFGAVLTYKEIDIPVLVGYSNFISAGVQKD